MFVIDPALTHVDVARDRVVAIIESVNQPHVAIPGRPPQAAQAFVTGVRNPNATFSLFVYLLLVASQEPVIYSYEVRQFTLEQYRDVEAEALNFVESMGFMMENVNFRNLARAAQDEILGRLPLFVPPPETVEATLDEEGSIDERSQRLARLLGAF